jgi:hypothetical protein
MTTFDCIIRAFGGCACKGCCKPHHRKGYCNGHYQRLLKYGDPLGGGTSKGELLRWIREVALRHTGYECLAWPFTKDSGGYGRVSIDGKKVAVSRYVCELVHGAPPTPEHEAAHSCGKGHDGCISPIHLDWKTPAQNQADRLVHGTSNSGERNGCSKLTEAAVREIIALKGVGYQRNLAARFGVSPQAISDIQAGRRWAWLSEEVAS